MKKSDKIKIWMFTVWGIIALTLVVWNKNQYPKKLIKFHDKEIKGIVTYISSSSGGTRISVNNEPEKQLIFTEYNENVESFFYRFISKGDSIFKAPHDDYVHVFKNKKEYLFKTTKN